jgi:hypothetical protein
MDCPYHMSEAKIRHDATASTRGTIYHLCVAVAKCYELQEGQKLLIEELGDVTIEGDQQVEVKQYSDNLTDGHHNFWNALKNWSDDGYDHTPYAFLILHTTQEFGPEATIAEWNEVNADKRLELLLAINKKFETSYKKAKEANSKRIPSAVLKLQRFVLDAPRQAKLKIIISKVWIEAKAKDLPNLYEELKQDRIRGVLSGKKVDYLNSLIGFVCRADKKAGEHWEVTYDMFEAKLGELNATYNNETRRFPQKHFAHRELVSATADRDDLFVKKIRDIEYTEVICKAIHQYEATMATLDEEFKTYAVDPSVVENYCSEVVDRFGANYSIACRECLDEVKDSKTLFDKIIGSPASSIPGFGDTPDGFRNGLLHQRMNVPAATLKWRISKK